MTSGSLLVSYPCVVSPSFSVTLFNAKDVVAMLYEEAGQRLDDPSKIFERSNEHVPGGIMSTVQSITIPTPTGMKATTIAAVNQLLMGREVQGAGCSKYVSHTPTNPERLRFLADMEKDPEALRKFSYQQLDEMRFAFVAVQQLADKGAFDPSGSLTPLAKRDLKRNCRVAAQPATEEASVLEARVQRFSAKPQKGLRQLLMEACTVKWPYTPAEKAAVISVEQDPNQPRHKPLFCATVELTMVGKKKFKGSWQPTKRDAENDACSIALNYLHEKG